jgi:hypothetical protein
MPVMSIPVSKGQEYKEQENSNEGNSYAELNTE